MSSVCVLSPDEVREMVGEAVRDALAASINATEASPWMNTHEAADYLRLTPGALRAKVQKREVPYSKTSGRLLFNRTVLDNWLSP